MDIQTGLSLGSSLFYFVPPMILLPVVMVACVVIYRLIFIKLLPTRIFNFFIGPIALLGFFIWAVSMKIGFYDFFRSIF